MQVCVITLNKADTQDLYYRLAFLYYHHNTTIRSKQIDNYERRVRR